MCGFLGAVGKRVSKLSVEAGLAALAHRGPDASGVWSNPTGLCVFGHHRLSIIDLSDQAGQPMTTADGRYTVIYNGEIYNYLELMGELGGRQAFRTSSDTEVLLAAYAKWGTRCLDRMVGMFAFAIWDESEQTLFAARDRFGVKPLFISRSSDQTLVFGSEVKALHAFGIDAEPDPVTWATYFATGMYDHSDRTFWKEISQLPPGYMLHWDAGNGVRIDRWYDVAEAALAKGYDERDDKVVADELLSLLENSVKLRLRSDVPVGISLSGGLDSSMLLALIHRMQKAEDEISTFTFYCDDLAYDETPWAHQVLKGTGHPAHSCLLTAKDVPELAARVQSFQDEPFGGLPILGLAKVHERAQAHGVTVILDGNGIDEGWAGYDYYSRVNVVNASDGPVQGTTSRPTRPDCLRPDFAALSSPLSPPNPFRDPMRNLQYRDLRYAKIPRCMRFADRVSMMYSRELREPFLDHRIIELGLRQPDHRKIRDGVHKFLPRSIAMGLLPEQVRQAPKRPLQTPQREWLRGPLAEWATEQIEAGLRGWGSEWLMCSKVREAWSDYLTTGWDNSFPVWQWITVGLMSSSISKVSEGRTSWAYQVL